MSHRSETRISGAFNIDTIVTVYNLKFDDTDNREMAKTTNISVGYDFWQLLYLDDGEYETEVDSKNHKLKPGQLIITAPGTKRTDLIKKGVRLCIISFRCSGEKIHSLEDRVITTNDFEQSVLSKIITDSLKIFTVIPDGEEEFGQKAVNEATDCDLQVLKNNLELFLIELYNASENKVEAIKYQQNQSNFNSRRFDEVREYMLKNINKSITVYDIVNETGISKSTLERLFTQKVNCGAMHYFLKLKIDRAKELIKDSDMSFTEISEELGFSSIHYFSKTFKKYTGVSPRGYAKTVFKV